MKELNLPPFYVGQKVVCLKDGHFHKKGDTYTVIELLYCSHCNVWHVMTSETVLTPASKYDCDCKRNIGDTIYMGGNAKYFVPVQENFQSISLEKILEQETSLISAS